MGLYDEQIRQRIRCDDEIFSDAFVDMAGVVMGERIVRRLNDSRVQAKTAIDEILKFYRVKSQELPDSVKDINDQLEYLMRPSGIMRRTVNLEGDWFKDAFGPMLGSRVDDGTPVALLPSGLGYDFYDTSTGKRQSVNRKTAALIDSEAICFYKPLPLRKIGIPELLRYIVEVMSPVDFVSIGLATLAVTLVGLLVPKLNNIIYNNVITDSSVQLLLAVFTFLLCVNISQALMRVVQNMMTEKLSGRMNMAVESAGMMRLLSLPADFFKKYSAGELSKRIGYLNSLCSMLASAFFQTGLTSLFSLIYIGQMVKYGPGLVAPGLLVILVTAALSVAVTMKQIKTSMKEMELDSKESGLSYSLLAGIQKIKLSGAEKRAFAKWAGTYIPVAKLTYDPPALIKLSSVITTCVSLVGTIVIYYFTIKTNVALADYFAFQSAYGMVMGAFSALTGMVTTFARIKPTLEMVRPVLETVPEISEDKKVVTKLSGSIELNNVSFRYSDSSPLIIDDLSLKIRPGQYVAIVGYTGCGKSTLLRLMLGFERPQKGAVYYDGKDLSSLDLKSLRRNIGTVMQNGKLFQGDIFSNITVTAPWLTMDDAWAAAEMAGIADDIKLMPMGMHTILSEGSGGISGGQRQRITIARAIAPKPKILMFDEATSALDNITQKKVSDALENLKCTRIVIAHRLSTIRECDRIIVLDHGKIIEDGKYEELIAAKGFFAELVERQRLDTEKEPAVTAAN